MRASLQHNVPERLRIDLAFADSEHGNAAAVFDEHLAVGVRRATACLQDHIPAHAIWPVAGCDQDGPAGRHCVGR